MGYRTRHTNESLLNKQHHLSCILIKQYLTYITIQTNFLELLLNVVKIEIVCVAYF